MSAASVNAQSCKYCFIDIDANAHRSRLGLSAAFVYATDSRYGFSSKDMRKLGGSELSRIKDLMAMDHEWSSKIKPQQSITTKLPPKGSRVVFRLYWDKCPLACENFATLCTNGGNSLDLSPKPKGGNAAPVGESGKELTYRNSIIHRIIPNFIVQGGDFVFGNGSGGESIYGKKFKDERAGLLMSHGKEGVLSMGNSGKNSNTSQFFVTLCGEEGKKCDGKHVVFGEVVSGMEVLHEVESFGSSDGTTSTPITITDCGAFTPLHTPGSGSWYDRPDPESYSGITPEFMVRFRVGVVVSTKTVGEKFEKALGEHASVVLFVLDEEEKEGRGKEEVCKKVLHFLSDFSLDVVVVAPACSNLLERMEVPPSWEDAAKKLPGGRRVPEKEHVFVQAKPVEVLPALLNRSWLGQQSGWILSGSFV